MPNQKTIRAGVAAGGLAERAPLIGYRLRPFGFATAFLPPLRLRAWRSLGVVIREPYWSVVHVLLVIYLTKPHRQGAPLRHHTVTNYDLQAALGVLVLDNIALGGHVDAIQELTDVLVLHRADLLDESAAIHKGARLS